MRVLLYTDSDAFSGTERHILDLAESLPAHGVKAVIACPSPSPLAERATGIGLEIIPVSKHGLIDVSAVKLLRRRMSQGFDLLHAHNGRTALTAALTGGPAVASQHFLDPDHTQRRGATGVVYRWAHHWVNTRVRHHIAISGAVQTEMIKRRDVASSRVTVVPNGVQPPRDAMSAPQEVRASLGVPDGAPLVVCVARLEREKNVISLIEAIQLLRERVPDVRCVVAGEGSCRPRLEDRIRELGLGSAFQLLGFRSDALSIVNAGDLFVLPSLAEPSGLAILEAMALGKAVVATQAGGPVEIVKDGVTGLLMPPEEPRELCRVLFDLIADPHRRESMGRAGELRFREKYTASEMARGTADVYRKVLSGG